MWTDVSTECYVKQRFLSEESGEGGSLELEGALEIQIYKAQINYKSN